MMKNAFYFTLKPLFILKIFRFFLNFLVMYKNGLIRKIWLLSKYMMSQPGKQTIQFGKLIEYDIRNILL